MNKKANVLVLVIVGVVALISLGVMFWDSRSVTGQFYKVPLPKKQVDAIKRTIGSTSSGCSIDCSRFSLRPGRTFPYDDIAN